MSEPTEANGRPDASAGGAVATGAMATGSTATGVMAGHGYYAHHAATQGGAASLGLGLLTDAAADVAVDVGVRVRIADLGCAQGRNSLGPVGTLLDALTASGEVRPVEVVHTDLPSNDWATLFDVLAHDPTSYLHDRRDVYPSVVGRSFYERLFPAASLHVAWTSSTLHWLAKPPGPIADHFFVQLSTDEAARVRYRAESVADWSAFLDARSIELVPGGSVVFVDVLMGDDHSMGSEALFDTLEAALRAGRDRGVVTDDEYRAFAYPTWFRTLAELRAPFGDAGGTGRFVGSTGGELELVALTPVDLDDPFLTSFRSSGDAASYAASQVGFLRGFLAPSFEVALADRTEEERNRVLDELFADAAARIADDPTAVSPRYRLVAGRVRRR